MERKNSELDNMKRKIEIVETRSGVPTLKIENNFVYSKYNPLKNIKNFWDENIDKYRGHKSIVIYGLGLGYHIIELLNRVDEDFLIYVFDIDYELYDVVKDTKYIKKIKLYKNVEVIVGYTRSKMIKMSYVLGKSSNFIIINSILKVIPQKYSEIKYALNRFQIASIGIERLRDKMENCNKDNQSIVCNDISLFIEDKIGKYKYIVLVASGPSLDEKAFSIIKKHRRDILLFCVGRSLRALIRNGIYPNMFCIIDCQDLVYEQVKGLEDLEIPLTFLNTANSLTVKKYNGPKYIFYNKYIGQKYVIDTGKSVAIAILDIAIKCYPKSIIFVGQDLAYTYGKAYSDHSKYRYDDDLNYGEYINKVESVEGKEIPTTEGLKSFKRLIERKIKDNSQISYFNYSKGAHIEGTKVLNEYDFIRFFE